jgi:hypothetical protein
MERVLSSGSKQETDRQSWEAHKTSTALAQEILKREWDRVKSDLVSRSGPRAAEQHISRAAPLYPCQSAPEVAFWEMWLGRCCGSAGHPPTWGKNSGTTL